MALKSKEWFYKQCLGELPNVSRLAHLSWTALQKGVGQQDQTRGHVSQAIGATQGFLDDFPQHRQAIRQTDPTEPFDIGHNTAILRDWKKWFAGQNGTYGPTKFGYNYDTLRGYLTRNLGGRRTGGGGGDDEFKIVLRLMAEFV